MSVRIRFAGLLALATAMAWGVVAPEALACRCAEPAPEDAYRGADAVVQASVTKVVPASDGPGGTAILHVSRAWKADVPKEIAVFTVTSCAYIWREGERHILFLIRDSNGLYSTARCLGNRRMDEDLLTWLKSNGQAGQVQSREAEQ